MEIHLLLEGEQVGPLTAEQVRQYLGEGLITGDDLASLEGVDDWHPLDVVLARFPASESTTQNGGAHEPALNSSPTVETIEYEDASFLVPSETNPSFETGPITPIESAVPLTATQKNRRKLSRIVIQPILPIETKLPAPKRTGRTMVTLEPIRPTTALPPVTGHRSDRKSPVRGTVRTGALALNAVPETPVLVSAPVPVGGRTVEIPGEPNDPISESIVPVDLLVASSEPVSTLAAPVEEAASTRAPVESILPVVVETETFLSESAPVPAAPLVEPVAAPAPPEKSAILEKPSIPEKTSRLQESPVPENSASHTGPYSSPQFSVLPKGGTFMPPSVRSVGGAIHRPPGKFPIAGVALGLFFVLVIVACVYLLAVRGASPGRVPDKFAPRAAVIVPTAIPTPGTAPPAAIELSDLGMKRQAAGDLDGAIHDYDQALALDPKAVEVFYRRGLARQAERDLPGAVADYTQVIALDPQQATAYSNRGYVRQATNDLEGALSDYAHALVLNPKLPVVYNNIGLIKVKKGDIDGAITAYGRAVALDPHMAFAFYNRGVARNTEGDVDEAVADFSQAIAVNPKIALAYCNRGIARESKGDTDGALADFSQALSLDPTLTDAFVDRGRIRLAKGDVKGAVNDDDQAIALDANNAPAYDQLGFALMGESRTEAALADFKKFCTLAPNDPAADEARLYVWVLANQTNANGDADAELSTALLNTWNSTPENLTSKIAAFLLGHINESDLIADAASPNPAREPGQYCRVWYFAGMKRLLAGDTMTAAGYFQKCTATGRKDFAEYGFALAQLQAMNAGPEIGARPVAGN